MTRDHWFTTDPRDAQEDAQDVCEFTGAPLDGCECEECCAAAAMAHSERIERHTAECLARGEDPGGYDPKTYGSGGRTEQGGHMRYIIMSRQQGRAPLYLAQGDRWVGFIHGAWRHTLEEALAHLANQDPHCRCELVPVRVDADSFPETLLGKEGR